MPDHLAPSGFQPEWARQFDYDASAPLHARQAGAEDRDGVAVRDVAFAGPLRPNIPAYVVAPSGPGPFAGVIFGHWFEPPNPTSSRDQFVDEAVTLARSGVASVLIDGLFPWRGSPTANDPEYDRRMVASSVIELRRSLDLLVSLDGVDAGRLAYVGHDFHAMHGSLLAAVDARLKAAVLMAGTPRYADWFLRYWPSYLEGDGRDRYLREMAAVDPVSYVGQAARASLFFQFARDDRFVPESVAREYFEAASQPKRVEWYDADHFMNQAARDDRAGWLAAQLGPGASGARPRVV